MIPEYVGVVKDFIIVIEDKPKTDKHVLLDGSVISLETNAVVNYAMNGALFYAKHLAKNITYKRRRKMTPERREFINGLLEHYQPTDAQDVQEMLKDLLGDTLQGMLEAEMDQKLGYSKYDYQNKETDDSRNGYSHKNKKSFFL